MRMPSRNFRGGKSLGGGGGGATGLCVKAKASFPCGAVCCLRTFVGHLTNCSSPPLSTIVSFIVMHVVMPLAYNINCPIIYLKNHHDCVLQNQEPPDRKYCRIRSWKPLGTFTVCINNKTLITYATN